MERRSMVRHGAAWLLAATGLLTACADFSGLRGAAGGPTATPPAAAAPGAPPVVATAPAPAPAPAPATPPAPPPVVPFDEAVLAAANTLLGRAQLAPAPAGAPYTLVIDPLIDGVTGAQSQASRAMGERIVALIRERYAQQYAVQPFTAGNVEKSPLVLVGTFTGVNKDRKTEGMREAYRICLALADLKTGKLVSKGLAFSRIEGVDATPLPAFRDAPAFAEDNATTGYVRTCQGTRAGDPINPLYADRIVAAALLSEAVDAYAAGRYEEAFNLYKSVASTPPGQQLRTWSGLYLTSMRLRRPDEAARAFGQLVDQGLEAKKLSVKFLFRPGSTGFATDPRLQQPYPMWLREIATAAQKRQSCMELVGHTSASGPEPVNERLSLLRAESVRQQIERLAPPLAKRMVASGAGSRETLIGTGRDDASDAIDRRVDFRVIGC